MAKKMLNVKNMKETIVNYCGGDPDEFNEIWDTFHKMACLGFITRDEWSKFFEQCKGWEVYGDFLIDNENGAKIVFDFDNGTHLNQEYQEYRA